MPYALDQVLDDMLAHVDVQIGNMQYTQTLAAWRKRWQGDLISDDANGVRIAARAAVHTNQFERRTDDGMGGVPIFRMKKAGSATVEHV